MNGSASGKREETRSRGAVRMETAGGDGMTPVWDFARRYAEEKTFRLHMPGHKGRGEMERFDLTEIEGAPPLYPAAGILRESEENAAELFGAGRTVYSAEGSSLCIRAMVFLARLLAERRGIRPLILAGRNAHRSFLSAAVLLGVEVAWVSGEGLLSCCPGAEELEAAISALPERPAAVYLTSPDYLGNRIDTASLAGVCHAYGMPLLVDNAHGAYLRFLPEDQHPLSLGADMTCDSAHKTLPVLTGGAYLQIHREADPLFALQAERAMALFASTSPSWLILQSLDRCNARMRGAYREELAAFVRQTEELKNALREMGYPLAGSEPLKITLMPKAYGYTGKELQEMLRPHGLVCEFADPDALVMMLTPENGPESLQRIRKTLAEIPRLAEIPERPPRIPAFRPALPLGRAMLSPAEEVPVEKSLGRVLADPGISCPPAVPILISGEEITEAAVECFQYYGITRVSCVLEDEGRI